MLTGTGRAILLAVVPIQGTRVATRVAGVGAATSMLASDLLATVTFVGGREAQIGVQQIAFG